MVNRIRSAIGVGRNQRAGARARWVPMTIGVLALAVVTRLLTGAAPPAPSWLAGIGPILVASLIGVLESRTLRTVRAHYPVRHRPRGRSRHLPEP